jgi:rod shape determining protein RodA
MNVAAQSHASARHGPVTRALLRIHLDGVLLAGIGTLLVIGMFVLYSAVGQEAGIMYGQVVRVLVALLAMFVMAQVDVSLLRRAAPWIYLVGIIMLLLVLLTGEVGKGAQRWLNIGVRFQPSELMKLALPAMLAWLLHDKRLPPSPLLVVLAISIIVLPVMMIALQPDLGTAILIALTGATVIFLAGLGMVYIFSAVALILASMPVLWYLMHDYQKSRVLTLFNPEADPLGAGYHIIQSKIAIGSGGIFGKGWLNGSQGQLEFLPERSTDFIFAVIGEEFGLLGALAILALYLGVAGRGFVIAATAQDTFSRLLAGSISFTFFFYVFVNSAMVTGLIPVVGVPLPLISSGGTSMVTLLAGFGILMSIQTHRKLLPR